MGGWGRETPAHLPAALSQLRSSSLGQPSEPWEPAWPSSALPSRQVQTCPGLAGQICRFCLTPSRRLLIAVCGTHLEMARARPRVLREAAQAERASDRQAQAKRNLRVEAQSAREDDTGQVSCTCQSPALLRRQAQRPYVPRLRSQNYNKPRN